MPYLLHNTIWIYHSVGILVADDIVAEQESDIYHNLCVAVEFQNSAHEEVCAQCINGTRGPWRGSRCSCDLPLSEVLKFHDKWFPGRIW